MSKKFVQLMLCMVLVSVLVVSAGCAPKKGAVSPKFPEDSATATVGGQRGTGESAFGEGAGEGIGEGDLAIRQDQLVRERLFTEATQELQTIYFDYDSAVLKPEAKQKLERGAAWLKQNPTVNVQIEGHCDERGTNEYNLALGERRALSARRYLVSLGVSDARIFTISYGEERPAVEGHDESAWKFNRRAEFKVSF